MRTIRFSGHHLMSAPGVAFWGCTKHTPRPEETWDQAYLPIPCGQAQACENFTFLQLRWRAKK